MITEYFVCYGPSTEALKKNVDAAIKNGWQPFGGVAVAMSIKWLSGQVRNVIDEREEIFCQACCLNVAELRLT